MRYLLLSSLLCVYCLSFSQKSKQKSSDPIAAKTTGMTVYDGFVKFYHDPKTDKIFLEINKFDTEFLYVYSLTAGLGSNDIGLDRNQLGGEKVVYFERHGPKIFLKQNDYFLSCGE